MLKASVVVAVVVLVACGSSSKSSSEQQANPCATRNATYLETFTEMAGGTCGPIAQEIVNIGSDGTISNGASISCAMTQQDGCTARDSGCTTTTSNGCTATIQTDVTFAADGSSASGLESVTVTCPSGSSCGSTYQVSAQRQ
jgi:hypothetical protein